MGLSDPVGSGKGVVVRYARTAAVAGIGAALMLTLSSCTDSTGGRRIETGQSGVSDQSVPSAQLPQSDPEPAIVGYENAEQWWGQMSPEEQVASVLMFHYPGVDDEAVANFVNEYQPAGMILMGDNIPDPEGALASSIPDWSNQGELPLLVAIDQEGGVVSRLDEDPGRGALELRDGDPAATEASFADRAAYLEQLGINTNFGIVADTTSDQNSFIWTRILGSTPEEAAIQVSAAVEGENGKVLSAVKHFPGHGTVAADSHLAVPSSQMTLSDWFGTAALPFRAAVDSGVDMVMMGHLAFPQIAPEPASLSPRWHEILREDLGFSGVIVTDDMKMLRDSGDPELADPVKNAVSALNAGSTLILDIGGDTQESAEEFAASMIAGLSDALASGELSEAALKKAGLQLLEVREDLR